MPTPPTSPRRIALAALALLAAGCEEGRHDALAPKPKKAASAPAKAAEPVFIVGRRTQEIKDAKAELKGGQARQVQPRITAKDPITLQGNAYVAIVGQTSILSIRHAMDLYRATNDRYPRDYDEFMSEIIKANNIALPLLPAYQEYGYDAERHQLIILEYPDRK